MLPETSSILQINNAGKSRQLRELKKEMVNVTKINAEMFSDLWDKISNLRFQQCTYYSVIEHESLTGSFSLSL